MRIDNIQTEWPLPQVDFNRFLLDKYGSYEKIEETHHYETVEIKNSQGVIMLAEGLEVESDFTISYYDWWLGTQQNIISAIK